MSTARPPESNTSLSITEPNILTAFNDAYQVLRWLTESSEVGQYLIDPTRVAVGGTSAGATITVGMFLRYRDEGRDISRIRLLVLEDGSYVNKSASYSTYHNPINKLWNANVTRYMWEMYLPQGIEGLDERTLGYAVPALAKDLSGLPPTMVLCAQWDDLTNDAIAFAHRLLESGVSTEIHVCSSYSVSPIELIGIRRTSRTIGALFMLLIN